MGAAAFTGILAVLLRACEAGESDPPHPTDLGFPPAPVQEDPVLDEDAGDPEEVPITALVDAEWAAETAERTEISERALVAYAGAAARISHSAPECGLGWNTLAGIGQAESVHGQFGESTIDEGGVVDPPITGVALDGSEGVMEIEDTDDGELDGDDEYDRAVGPMQFIPTTWEQYAADGSGSGEPDIHQYDDAALTAAIYLCDIGGDLTGDRGWNDAVTAYNQSVDYVNEVADYAEDYAQNDTAQ